MDRYPHTLAVSWTEEGTFVDGEYTPGDAKELTLEGRAEANGRGNLIRTDDGAQIVYAWVFYLTPTDENIPMGAEATLTHETGTWSGTVKRLGVNQRGAQIWL